MDLLLLWYYFIQTLLSLTIFNLMSTNSNTIDDEDSKNLIEYLKEVDERTKSKIWDIATKFTGDYGTSRDSRVYRFLMFCYYSSLFLVFFLPYMMLLLAFFTHIVEGFYHLYHTHKYTYTNTRFSTVLLDCSDVYCNYLWRRCADILLS